MPSFDIVSKYEMQEVENAINMVKRDILNRFDFKGSSSSLELNKSEGNINGKNGGGSGGSYINVLGKKGLRKAKNDYI